MKKKAITTQTQSALIVEKYEKPYLYNVLIHNDDYTPMEFVVLILERFFFLNRLLATKIMMEAHIHGNAICGIFTKEVAETKIYRVTDFSIINEHPLRCSMEVAS